jgi:hypothetical protein
MRGQFTPFLIFQIHKRPAGIGTMSFGCRGFNGPVPQPLSMSYINIGVSYHKSGWNKNAAEKDERPDESEYI